MFVHTGGVVGFLVRKATLHEMAGSDEEDGRSVLLSEEDSDLEVGMGGAACRAVDTNASEEWTKAAKGREKAKRRQTHIQIAAELDATCEEEAHEEGLLMPRTLAELASRESVVWVRKLQPPHFRDEANQEAEAQILTLQGNRHVTSKIDRDSKLSGM